MTIKQSLVLIFTAGIIFGILAILNKCPYGYGVTITSMIFFFIVLIILSGKDK